MERRRQRITDVFRRGLDVDQRMTVPSVVVTGDVCGACDAANPCADGLTCNAGKCQ